MSRLEELIQEYCPDGVEYKKLEEVIIDINTGLNPRKFFKVNTVDAENYYVTIREMVDGKIVFSERTDRINDEAIRLCNNRSKLDENTVLFSGTGTIGRTVVLKEKPTNWDIKEGVYAIHPIVSKILPDYLGYILHASYVVSKYMSFAVGGTVNSVPMGQLKKLEVPVPPLPVQQEIVRILDSFTELTAELKARKKQYEYYRNELIQEYCHDGVEYRKLEDCCNVLDRKRKPISKGARQSGEYPYYGANGIQDYVSDYIFDGTFILCGEDGSRNCSTP